MRRIARFIHERSDWPHFSWRQDDVVGPLAALRYRQGRLLGRMESLGFALQNEATLEALTEDVRKSSEIEGIFLAPEQVRSSLARRLGLDVGGLVPADRHVDGVVEMVLDATRRFDAPLTAERLFGWHAALFPTGRSGLSRIVVGAFRDDRDGPMRVVSGGLGRERVHFEAPEAARLPREMKAFLEWFETPSALDPVLRAAIAHLWFETIHPFDDGNGRIGRAIADLALARSEGTSQRFYSLSAQVRVQRDGYYGTLEATQRGGLDVTAWLLWFLQCLDRAIDGAETLLARVLQKARFWEAQAGAPMNERQRAMLNRLLDGFEGKLTTSKWAALSKCSQDTALRDIEALVLRGVLVKEEAGGRSTHYRLRDE